MQNKQLSKRLDKDRATTSITLRMPVDVVDDLKEVAPLLGFSSYQALLKAYVGQGLREDLENLDNENPEWTDKTFKKAKPASEVMPELIESLIKKKKNKSTSD